MAVYAIAINLSMGGVLLSATPALPVGSQCTITIFDGGINRVMTGGKVVRSDAEGTAIQFAKALPAETCQSLIDEGARLKTGLVGSFRAYFQVGRNQDNAGCERLLGVSKKTFQRVFYSTYAGCIAAAVIPAWVFRGSIMPLPVWEKIGLSFLYGAIWLLILQPTLDLGILQFLKKRKAAPFKA